MSNEDKKQKFTDIPPLAAVCLVVTLIGLIVALLVKAPIQVTTTLVALLTALAVYLKRL